MRTHDLPRRRSAGSASARDLPAPRVVAVVPALDEAGSIATVVAAVRAQPLIDCVVVVNNGSTDGTGAIARGAGARVVHEPRRGYGRACWTGVRAAADADVVVLLDGDAADDPADLPRVLAPLLDDRADLVVGSRALGSREAGSMTRCQVSGNRVAARLMSALHGVEVTDLGPMRAIWRDDLLALEMREMTYGWSTEMAVKAARAGLRYAEVPVAYRRREAGASKVGGTVLGAAGVGVRIARALVRAGAWRPPEAR